MTELKYEKPEYSHIALDKSANHLIVQIPKRQLGIIVIVALVIILSIITLILFSLFFLIWAYLLIISDETHLRQEGIAAIVLCIFAIVALLSLTAFALKEIEGDRILLKIDRETFEFQRNLGNRMHIIQGTTKNLQKITSDPDLKTLKIFCMGREISRRDRKTIKEQKLASFKEIEVGGRLRQAERDWLHAEISEFLDRC